MKKLLIATAVIAAAGIAIHADVNQRQISPRFRAAVLASLDENDNGAVYSRLAAAAKTRKDDELLAKFGQLDKLDAALYQAGRDEAEAFTACDQQKQCAELHRVEAKEKKLHADESAIMTDLRREFGLADAR